MNEDDAWVDAWDEEDAAPPFRQLPTSFTAHGFLYTQTARTARYALYAQQRGEQIQSYEVIRIRCYGMTTFPGGQTLPPREAFPPASAWGTDGWTFSTQAEAAQHMQRLEKV